MHMRRELPCSHRMKACMMTHMDKVSFTGSHSTSHIDGIFNRLMRSMRAHP